MINRAVLVGRMTRDPELRRTGTGAAVASFTLALNRNYQSSDGQQADYIPCVVWNKTAENVVKYCSKGALVGVQGRLRSRSYDNAQGQKVYVVEVVCDLVQFIDTRNHKKNNTSDIDRNADPLDTASTLKMTENQVEDLEKEFDNSANTFDIMDTDIQF